MTYNTGFSNVFDYLNSESRAISNKTKNNYFLKESSIVSNVTYFHQS